MRMFFALSLSLLALVGCQATPVSRPVSYEPGVSATDGEIGALQERLRQQPSDAASATRLGLAYLQRARETSDPTFYTRAEAALQHAYAQAPEDPDTLIGLGSLALARHQFQDGLEWGKAAIARGPRKAPAYGVVVDALTELGRYEEAVAALQQMIDVRPDQSSYARVSYARELVGDIDGAIGAMQVAVEAASERPEPSA